MTCLFGPPCMYCVYNWDRVLWTGVFGHIIQGPENTLLVRCMSNTTSMTCISNDTIPGSSSTDGGQNTIAWTYDGNTVMGVPCNPFFGVFSPILGDSNQHCGIEGNVIYADAYPSISTISGPYGCTDQRSAGFTATSMLIILGMAANEHSKNQLFICTLCTTFYYLNSSML